MTAEFVAKPGKRLSVFFTLIAKLNIFIAFHKYRHSF